MLEHKRIVIKVGSSLLTKGANLNRDYIHSLANSIVRLINGKEIVLVTSGAIAAGSGRLSFSKIPSSIPLRQAAAAVGQALLMRVYEEAFSKAGKNVAQILLTHQDLSNRKSYLNFHNTIMTLLRYKVIPIINENDTVAVEELRFGDNDTLAALVAAAINASLLIILTNTDGLFDTEGRVVKEVKEITPKILQFIKEEKGAFSFGGMKTKIDAASIVTRAGATMIIMNGERIDDLIKAIQGSDIGTRFLPQKPLPQKKHWIFYNLRSCGKIIVDAGAKEAIKKMGKSLLPSGVKDVQKDFKAGDAVTIVDEEGEEFAKGLTNYGAKELLKIKGRHTKEIKDILGACFYEEVIHRDNMVLI